MASRNEKAAGGNTSRHPVSLSDRSNPFFYSFKEFKLRVLLSGLVYQFEIVNSGCCCLLLECLYANWLPFLCGLTTWTVPRCHLLNILKLLTAQHSLRCAVGTSKFSPFLVVRSQGILIVTIRLFCEQRNFLSVWAVFPANLFFFVSKY